MILIGLFLCLGMTMAQMRTSGSVTSSEDGEPIVGASVKVVGTKTGAITDVDGRFSFYCPEGSNLEFSYIGMIKQTAKASSNMKVVLDADNHSIDEVVVTGYGVTKRRAFTGAATTLGGGQISARNDVNPIKALEGTVPGVQLSMSSGQPGAPATIYIRGRGSLNSGTQPLYVIDGVPMNADAGGMRKDEEQSFSPLATLASSDIETVTILKDATATSIYGARAANGVILITTKRGSAGRPKINFRAKVGFETMPSYTSRYKLANAAQNTELATEALLNGYADSGANSTFGRFNDAYGLGLEYNKQGATDFYDFYTGGWVSSGNDTDWLKEITRTGLLQDYGVDISGGGSSETAPKYYASLNYTSEDGLMKGKDMDRYSFRLNLDHAPTSVIKYGISTNLSYTTTNMGAGGGYYSDPLTQAYMMNPMTPVYDSKGDWNFDTTTGYNPVAQRSELGDISLAKEYRALVSGYFQINFNKNLFWQTRAGIDAYLVDEFGYWSFLQPQGLDSNGMGEDGMTTRIMLNITNTLNYINTFNDVHNVNFMIGQEGQTTNLKYAYLAGSNYPVDDISEISLTSVPGYAYTNRYNLRLNSYFANAQYDYAGKYYASASFRYDGSSRFGANHRWAPFWSVGAKWRMSSEKFMESTKNWLTNLTVRASYGTSGNQEVGDVSEYSAWYTNRDLYEYGYKYNGKPGSARMQTGNEDLKWEQTNKFNVGLDFTVFDRITMELDYYHHTTNDMVFAVPISETTGLEVSYRNMGKLVNYGFEATINAKIIKTKDFTWDATLVASYNKNEIKKLSTDMPIEGSIQTTEVGYPIYQYKMKEWAGVDPATGRGMWYKNESGDETTFNYNEAAKRYLGSANPKWQGSFSTSLAYKGFDLAAQFNFSLGGKIFGDNLRYDENIGASWYENYTMYVYNNRWQNPGDVTDVPRLSTTATNYNSASSRFLMDGDYLKIRSVTFGYTIPRSITEHVAITKARIYFSAENLYTFTASNYRGLDPAGVGANGHQWWNYPIPRSYMFGIDLSF